MKTEKTLFIQILIWAYNKQEDGFTWDELKKEFNLNQVQNDWAITVFRRNGNELFFIPPYKSKEINGEHTYLISEKGIPLAINYLNLKEAEKISKVAIIIALVSTIVTIVVGLWQIFK